MRWIQNELSLTDCSHYSHWNNQRENGNVIVIVFRFERVYMC